MMENKISELYHAVAEEKGRQLQPEVANLLEMTHDEVATKMDDLLRAAINAVRELPIALITTAENVASVNLMTTIQSRKADPSPIQHFDPGNAVLTVEVKGRPHNLIPDEVYGLALIHTEEPEGRDLFWNKFGRPFGNLYKSLIDLDAARKCIEACRLFKRVYRAGFQFPAVSLIGDVYDPSAPFGQVCELNWLSKPEWRMLPRLFHDALWGSGGCGRELYAQIVGMLEDTTVGELSDGIDARQAYNVRYTLNRPHVSDRQYFEWNPELDDYKFILLANENSVDVTEGLHKIIGSLPSYTRIVTRTLGSMLQDLIQPSLV